MFRILLIMIKISIKNEMEKIVKVNLVRNNWKNKKAKKNMIFYREKFRFNHSKSI